MDRESESEREVTRVPTDADLVSLARELNRLGVSYVVIGGFAINRLGYVRATEDIDLLQLLFSIFEPRRTSALEER